MDKNNNFFTKEIINDIKNLNSHKTLDNSKVKIHTFRNDIDNKTLMILEKAKFLFMDTEALGLKIERDRLCWLQIMTELDRNQIYLVYFDKNNNNNANIKKLLQNKSSIKVFHYAYFDICLLNHYLEIFIENIFCTRMLSKIIRTFTDRHGLKQLCKSILGIELNKGSQCSFWNTYNISDSQKQYAIRDVLFLPEILKNLFQKAESENRLFSVFHGFRCISSACQLRMNGYQISDLLAHRTVF